MFVKTDDKVQLYYQTAGDPANPALLLSNSLGTRWQMWQPQLAALTKHFYLISYDSRGHGESDKPAGPYSLTRLGQDALCVLGALGIVVMLFSRSGLWGTFSAKTGIDPFPLSHRPPASLRVQPVPSKAVKA